jgi:hypothetical protein
MNVGRAKIVIGFLIGVVTGISVADFPHAIASSGVSGVNLEERKFWVFVDEVKQNLVFGDEFVGSYSRTFTLSDGSRRTIELTPVVHRGMQVVELRDTEKLSVPGKGQSYMALNGTTTNGTLMVRIADHAETLRQLREQGWKLP